MEAGREGANTYIIHAVIDYVKLIVTLKVALADVQWPNMWLKSHL